MGNISGLAPEQIRALDRLKTVLGQDGFYLAGGGAVIWHCQHRQSRDLDLFTTTDQALDAVRARLVSQVPDCTVIAQSDATLTVLIEGALVDVVRYPYPTLAPPSAGPQGYATAGLLDLATMKLAAIAKRGIGRDFWDLYEILQRGPTLAEAGRAYRRRFGLAEADLYHVMRALTYFADAEKAPAAGMTPELWAKIEHFFRSAAPKLLQVAAG